MALKNIWWGSKQGQACPWAEEEVLGHVFSTGIGKPLVLVLMLLLCSHGVRAGIRLEMSGKQSQGSGSFCLVTQLS